MHRARGRGQRSHRRVRSGGAVQFIDAAEPIGAALTRCAGPADAEEAYVTAIGARRVDALARAWKFLCVHRDARIRAAEQGRSVSALVADFLASLSGSAAELAGLEAQQRPIRDETSHFSAGDRLGRDAAHYAGVRVENPLRGI